jgi:ADP-heptose:LPS heptosyltransferase
VRVETMRAVDRGVGRPLAWFLTGLRRVVPGRSPVERDAVRRVLFVKLSEMGALVLAAPAFAEARRAFPNAEITLLCFDENVEIARLVAGFDDEHLIVVPAKGLARVLLGLLGAVRRVRRARFDVLIDLEYFSRVSAVLAGMSGVPVRAGFHRFESEGLYCGDLYTRRVTFNPYLHIAQSMVALVRAAAADHDVVPHTKEILAPLDALSVPQFTPDDDDTADMSALLHGAGVPDHAQLVLVNPNSSDLLPLRRWPEGHFTDLVRGVLRERPDVFVILTGAAHETAVGERILSALVHEPEAARRCVSLIGRTSRAPARRPAPAMASGRMPCPCREHGWRRWMMRACRSMRWIDSWSSPAPDRLPACVLASPVRKGSR